MINNVFSKNKIIAECGKNMPDYWMCRTDAMPDYQDSTVLICIINDCEHKYNGDG